MPANIALDAAGWPLQQQQQQDEEPLPDYQQLLVSLQCCPAVMDVCVCVLPRDAVSV
jgi:hypothetical protein